MRSESLRMWMSGRGCGFALLLLCVAGWQTACLRVGPSFSPPATSVEEEWMETGDPQITTEPPEYRDWWRTFDDPVLSALVDTAYRENLNLRIAGVRVLQARAQLGIVIGQWYPQTQQATGSVTYNEIGSGVGFGAFGSRSSGSGASQTATTPVSAQSLSYFESVLGLTASWELDFWGKFRRAIESAEMSLLASVASYDAALVTLTADVASNYISIRTLEERLRIAEENVALQTESLRIARARYRAGATGERDVQQALTQLRSTEATVPQLETQVRQALNALGILVGRPPAVAADLVPEAGSIPCVPSRISTGIPVDLLRRRPDIRSAEYQAAAQCAQIGVARADLYPALSLSGTFDVLATNLGSASLSDMFSWKNRLATVGPSVRWDILNYGRIANNVRLQDAHLQELLVTYQNLVLTAQQEVEDGLVALLKDQQRACLLAESVIAARRTAELAMIQYREGAADYTTVITAQQALLVQQDTLATTRGQVPQDLIAVYRALGGGWQIREGHDFVPADLRQEMEERTDWDDLLKTEPAGTGAGGPHEILPPSPQW